MVLMFIVTCCNCCANGLLDSLRKISKQIQNEGNQEENRQSHLHQRFTWFGNSLRPQVADDEFTIIIRDYKVGVEALLHIPKSQYTQISLQGSQITNNRAFLFSIQVGNSTNTKYQNQILEKLVNFLQSNCHRRHQRTRTTPKQRSCTINPKKPHCFYKALY